MGSDSRAVVRGIYTEYELAQYDTLAAWETKAEHLRQQILASAGLLPHPARTPQRARVFGPAAHRDYIVEKVHFQSRPGVLVTGNLYRPASGDGPFPAVLCPHGHHRMGRLEFCENASMVGLCRNLARQGYVALSHDMLGYCDSKQFGDAVQLHDQDVLSGPGSELWGISLLGMQLWNNIRALDFLQSRPFVDGKRIACTGASGGGTQTFLLAAVDARVAVSAPVCMVSAHMQGGCACENAPNLRLDTNNVEIAALAAPRPQILVSATGDWTRNTPKVEYPWVRGIYALHGAQERVANAHIDAGHNYNASSADAVYRWLARWFGRENAYERFHTRGEDPQQSYDDPGKLMVFFDQKLPKLDPERFKRNLIGEMVKQQRAAWPKSRRALARYRREFGPAYRAALGAEHPCPERVLATEGDPVTRRGLTRHDVVLSRAGVGDQVAGVMLTQSDAEATHAVLFVHGQGRRSVVGAQPHPVAARLLREDCAVLAVDVCGVSHRRARHDARSKVFTTYNRTPTANSVQDVLTALAWLEDRYESVSLVGVGEGGMWCLLARALAPQVAACAVDLARFAVESTEAWEQEHFLPLIRRAGDIRTALALAAPSRLLMHNTGKQFAAGWAKGLYKMLGAADDLVLSERTASPAAIASFLLT